jgi:outer membrane protein OmpA-like peptidoglycan-associated protein
MRKGAPAAGLALLLCLGIDARAQAPAVNNGALDALKPAPRAPQHPAHRAPQHHAVPTPGPQTAARPAPATPAAPAAPKPPAVPVAPPEIAAIPPAVAVPVQHPPEPPSVPVAADAPGAVAPLPDGLRATFGTGRSELNAATEAAMRGFARPLRDTAQPVQVTAFAAGTPEDPSTPRRLSLARALAARAVLINEGIASTRIYVRALGAAAGDGPADRVDLSAAPAAAPTSTLAAPAAKP